MQTPRKFIIAKFSTPYIGSASRKIKGTLNEVGKQVYSSSEGKLFRSLCTHEGRVNEFQKPGVYRIPCECGLVNIGDTGRNLSLYVLKNIRLIARKPNSKNQLRLNTHGLMNHSTAVRT